MSSPWWTATHTFSKCHTSDLCLLLLLHFNSKGVKYINLAKIWLNPALLASLKSGGRVLYVHTLVQKWRFDTIQHAKISHGVHFTTVPWSFSQMPVSSCVQGAFEGHKPVYLDMSTYFFSLAVLSAFSSPLRLLIPLPNSSISPPSSSPQDFLESSGGILLHIMLSHSDIAQLLSFK